MDEKHVAITLGTDVMGWTKEEAEFMFPVWNPLKNIYDAWQALERLRGSLSVRLETHSGGWYIELENHLDLPISEEGKTAQEAICKAALNNKTLQEITRTG
ncbi:MULTISPECIES: hypothetical protein [unclassified Brevibacillus]|uniref:BC1872 family protein n=1 Tax=unclassified Brevibacillus TaxID=2684853 RepID=UPI00356860D5